MKFIKIFSVKYLAPLAGFIVYWLSKFLAVYFNIFKKRTKIDEQFQKRLSVFFTEIDFSKVRIIHNAFLPANIFNNKIAGMTYGNSIYTVYPDLLNNYNGFYTLIHELVHVGQMQKLNESVFSLKYGRQFFEYGGYSDKMPLEKQAYDFVRFIPFDPTWYLLHNTDISIEVKGSRLGALFQWLEKGVFEDRQSCEWFHASKYLNKYKDLSDTFGTTNFTAAIRHWIVYGKYEGREGM